MNHLTHINYTLNYDILKQEANEARKKSKPYNHDGADKRFNTVLKEWHISRHTSDYIESIMNDFKIKGKPRFYWLEPFFELPEHIDYGTTCSLNFVLSDDPAPVTILGKDYLYKQALLNTTVLHSVKNGAKERVLFKISIFDETYDEVVKRCL